MCAFLRDGCFVHCTVGMAARRPAAACGETCGWRAMVRAARRAELCATDFAAAAKGVRRYCAVPHKALPRTRAQHTSIKAQAGPASFAELARLIFAQMCIFYIIRPHF